MNKFADLHIHSSLKPFLFFRNNDLKRGNIWYQDIPKKNERDNNLVSYTQADFTTLIQSGIKIAFVSLYSFEQSWTNSWKTGPFTDILIHEYTKIPTRQINYIQQKSYNYFKELNEEIKFLLEQIKEPHTIINDDLTYIYSAKIPKNKAEFNQFLNEARTLIIIPTIEGANALFSGNAQSVNYIKFQELENNINLLKNKFCPFFITLAHHFDNGLCGHAKSIFGATNFQNFIISIFLNQKNGLENDLNPKGIKVIEKLLAINEFAGEKRILIDIKHMNTLSRKHFYSIIKSYNLNHQQNKIPIIASHMGYNGHPSFESLNFLCKADSEIPYTHTKRRFNEAIINLCDVDILEIFESEGLIGINLDQRIISNEEVVKEAEKKFNFNNTPELKSFWAKQIALNIISMAEVIIKANLENKEKVWNLFSLGSDFDGFINPIDAFITTNDYKELNKYLIIEMKENEFLTKHKFGLSEEQIVEKIMYQNAENFLLKHYFETQDSLT